MPYRYEILKNNTQRVSLVSFHRVFSIKPKLNYPDVDDRGFFRPEIAGFNPDQADVKLGVDRGPVVGVTEDTTVFVELRRDQIAFNAPLFVTSSDPAVMRVSIPVKKIASNKNSPASEKLYDSIDQEIQITGVKGGGGVLPNVAKVEVRYGSNQGPVIGELTVYVFTPFHINVVPHLVNLSGPRGYSVSYIFDVNPIFEMVRAIWQPCGIDFFVGAPENEFMPSNMNEVGKWKYPESDSMIKQAKRHHPDAINIYFVDDVVSDHDVIAYTDRPGRRLFKRCIIAKTDVVTEESLALTLAHEIGHFLDLSHTDKTKGTNAREDIWAERRYLMHPLIGYGILNPGLVTMKDLFDKNNPTVNHTTDPEWLTARRTVNSKEGPYK
jgi:hypothetical protein